MPFSKALRLLVLPWKFFAYLRLRHQRRQLSSMFCKVSPMERLRLQLTDSIRDIDRQIAEL